MEERKDKLTTILHRMIHLARILPKKQLSEMKDDSWSRNVAAIQKVDSVVNTVIDAYESARSIKDTRESWNKVETVLDTMTRFDVEARAFVEPSTRKPIACEHVTYNIMSARSTSPELSANYIK
jgi:hypothetical protein